MDDVPLKRSCGKCNACCKTHFILEIGKPIGKWCKHCDIGVGCKIYGNHPQSCQEFKCEWLKGFGKNPDQRPDRIKVVVCLIDYTMTQAMMDFIVNEMQESGFPYTEAFKKISEERDEIFGLLQIWEVTEGSINSSFVKMITTNALRNNLMVQKILLSGDMIKITNSEVETEKINEKEVLERITAFDNFLGKKLSLNFTGVP